MDELTSRLQLPIAPKERPFRPAVYWYLSFRCNLACKHCWVNSSPNVDTSSDLTAEEMVRAVDNIAELNPSGVILTGGEPLFHPGIMSLLSALERRRLPIHLETNAMMVTDHVLELAKRVQRDGPGIAFSVSLDGGDRVSHDWCRGKGSFDQTVAGLRRLADAGLVTDIQCVINRRNWASLGSLVELANELNLQYLKFVLTNPIGRANRFTESLMIPFSENHDVLHVLAEALDSYRGKVIIKVPPAMIPPALQDRFRHYTSTNGCSVMNITSCSFPLLGVLPDGSVTICAASRDVEEVYFGDIRTISVADVWRAKNLDAHRLHYLQANELTGICGDCIFKRECRGACRAHALAESGSLDGPYPVCAEMERLGHFPDAYRISKLAVLTHRVRAMAGGT